MKPPRLRFIPHTSGGQRADVLDRVYCYREVRTYHGRASCVKATVESARLNLEWQLERRGL